MIRIWYRDKIQFLENHAVLLFFGALLCLSHVLTFTFLFPNFVPLFVNSANATCWPFFESCGAWQRVPVLTWPLIMVMYGALSCWGLIEFWRGKKIPRAFSILVLVFILKILLLLQSYQTMGNYHLMQLWINLVFLILIDPRAIIQLLTVLFYVTAGFLKLNPEWTSGASLGFKPWWLVNSTLFYCSLIFVPYLEIVISWGLLASKKIFRWTAFSFLMLFHFLSYSWVGYFYPSIMICLLGIFPLMWSDDKTPSFGELNLFSQRKSLLLIVAFGVLQIAPLLQPLDPALYTDKRLWSLNMFDARSICYSSLKTRSSAGIISDWNFNFSTFGARVQCDPILFKAAAKNLCATPSSDPIESFQLTLLARRSTDLSVQKVIDLQQLCSAAKEM